jgi:hypothetical protein
MARSALACGTDKARRIHAVEDLLAAPYDDLLFRVLEDVGGGHVCGLLETAGHESDQLFVFVVAVVAVVAGSWSWLTYQDLDRGSYDASSRELSDP